MDEVALYRAYESTWRNMDRENNLVNQRIMWSLTMTSGFLVAETFLLGRVFEIVSGPHAMIGSLAVKLFVVGSFVACAILSALAMIVCFRVNAGVGAAFDQIQSLERRYKEHERRFEDDMKLPRPYGRDIASFRGNSAATIFPKAMAGVWTIFATTQVGAALVFAMFG